MVFNICQRNFQKPATSYLSGSQLVQRDTVTENIKPFGFPGSKFSRICTESPIRFKLDQEDSCLTKNNEANCLLIGQQAFTNIQVDAIGDESAFASPVIACFDSAGSSISCSNSNFAASTCQNAIVNSRYIIRTDSNTGYISQGIDLKKSNSAISSSYSRIPTVKLKIPGKAFLKSESRTSVTFKL